MSEQVPKTAQCDASGGKDQHRRLLSLDRLQTELKQEAGLVRPGGASRASGVATKERTKGVRRGSGAQRRTEERGRCGEGRRQGPQARVNMTACQSASSRSEKRERTSSTPANSSTVRCRAGWSSTSLSGIGGCDRGR